MIFLIINSLKNKEVVGIKKKTRLFRQDTPIYLLSDYFSVRHDG